MKRMIKSNTSPSRRSWFRVGPGLVLAVAASMFVWMRAPRQPGHPPTGPLPATRVQTTAVSRASAPDPEWIIKNAETLQLTPTQAATMRWLARRWNRETADLRAELKAASVEFDRAMAANGPRGVPLADVQRLALPVSDLTRQLAGARSAWWEEAASHLTQKQRQTATDGWSRRFQPQNRQSTAQVALNGESKGTR